MKGEGRGGDVRRTGSGRGGRGLADYWGVAEEGGGVDVAVVDDDGGGEGLLERFVEIVDGRGSGQGPLGVLREVGFLLLQRFGAAAEGLGV